MRIYMDHNATSPLCEPAAVAIRDALDLDLGNPSSVHEPGRRARDLVEQARRGVAELLSAQITDVVFTSGGTEADWLGVRGLAGCIDGGVWSMATAHPALTAAASAHGGPGGDLVVDGSGRLDLESVADACRAGAGVIAVELANHELGVVQEVREVARIAHEHGALVHCDAVQAVGRVPVNVTDLGVDSLAVSGHKIGGPMGVGALWVRPGLDVAGAAAGKQERGRRPGTENLLGIIGFGAAAGHVGRSVPSTGAEVRAAAEALEAGLRQIDGTHINGGDAPRVGNTINVAIDGALGEVVVQALDMRGVAVSTGAACSSGSNAPSPTLLALGLTESAARECLRFSLGPGNTLAEVQVVLELLPDIIRRARSFR